MRTTKLTTGLPEEFPALLYKAIKDGQPLYFYPDKNTSNPDDNVYTYITQDRIIIVFSPFTVSRDDGLLTPTNYKDTLDDIFIIGKETDYYLSCSVHATTRALEAHLLCTKARLNSKAGFKHECVDLCPKELSKNCTMRLKVITQASDLDRKHCTDQPKGELQFFPDMIFNRYKSHLNRCADRVKRAIAWEHTSK